MCVRPGDKFALCCLICGYCPPPESSLQLDFNLCIMSREWETKQKQKLNRNGTERGAGVGTEPKPKAANNLRTRFTPATPASRPLHPFRSPNYSVTNRFCAHMYCQAAASCHQLPLSSPSRCSSPAKGNGLRLQLWLRLVLGWPRGIFGSQPESSLGFKIN